uniref:Reverse transcriptase zinc-binding domain-containing protein n=1 Tax=Chenopodium quinoa TaxID=63459 RepID=A0A803MVP9_CHEQI
MKARYFRRIGILVARRGYNPSYVWRSLWGAKGLVQDGIGWRFGDGRLVKCWKEAWLVKHEKPHTPTKPTDAPEDMLVYELLTADGKGWDEEKVSRMLGEDAGLALQLPLPEFHREDLRQWVLTSDGRYSVKSGYWLAHMSKGGDDHGGELVDWWRKIWNMKIPPKIRHFLWGVIKGNIVVG